MVYKIFVIFVSPLIKFQISQKNKIKRLAGAISSDSDHVMLVLKPHVLI